MAASVNKVLFKIHSWLGLFNGVWLLFLGITGSLLVFNSELDAWIHKDILSVQPQQQRLPVDSLYKIVRAKYPTAMGTTIIHFPKEKTDCISFRIYVEDLNAPAQRWDEMYYMDINPYNGKILREGNYKDISKSFLLWCSTFHWNLQFGNIGVLIVTIAGILLFINILTGIIIYRKYFFKALIFRAPVKWKNWRTGTSGLHRYIGVWSIVFNILIFYSGLQMTWMSLTKDYYKKPEPLQYNNGQYASIDAMMNDVQKIFPGFRQKYFYIPFSKVIMNGTNMSYASEMGSVPGTPSIIPTSNSHIDFDVNTGKVVATVNANDEIKEKNLWEKFNYIAYSFHAGTFLGIFSRVLYVFVGIAPAFLSLSGFMLWWRRKKIIKPHLI
ncbi:MAG TPA: PepSY-associated TM helix domain-containing protein [Puia sp.]|nr:PepSY-associated TM helix domain-containing protein [Puia sp.]